MFPLSDDTHRVNNPVITYLIILISVAVFGWQFTSGVFEQYIVAYGFIPRFFSFTDPSTYWQIFTSMFMHGGFFHIISNLWFLHIFGDNVEDHMGHVRYLLFYLAAGIVATLVQYALDPGSQLPLIGASGAISGVAGAYAVWFHDSRVKTLVAVFYYISIIRIPAYIVLGYWFVLQVFSGLGSLASVGTDVGGVAFMAHIGGFVFGYVFAKIFR